VVNLQPPPARTLHALVDPDVTVAAFAGHWFFSQVEAGAWREGTQRGYAQHLVLRLCPFRIGPRPEDTLGQQPVRALRAGHVQALVEGLRRDGFAPGTVRVTVLLFTMVLDEAVDQGLLSFHPITKAFFRKKLAPLLKPPKGKKSVKAFTAEQVQRFLAVSRESSRLDDLYRVGFTTGLRLGELIGLQLRDDQVALVHGVPARRLRVERSRGTDTRTLDLRTGPTKSGASRWVDVGPDLGALLDRIKSERKRLALKHAWGPVPEWMFVTSNGTRSARATSGGTSPESSSAPASGDSDSLRTRCGTPSPVSTSLRAGTRSGSNSSWVMRRSRSRTTSTATTSTCTTPKPPGT
jgi:integrase